MMICWIDASDIVAALGSNLGLVAVLLWLALILAILVAGYEMGMDR